jgi:uncharacterized protein YcbX
VKLQAGDRAREPNIHGGLAVEAVIPDTNLRATAGVHISRGEPNLVVSLDHRPTESSSAPLHIGPPRTASVSPLTRFDFQT